MRILITGGGGFLGTWIVRELLKNPTYLITNFSRHPYEHLADLAVPTIRGDISIAEDVERALAQGFDTVFHVAGKVGMWGDPAEFDRINVEGTRHLLEASKRHGVKRFVFTGSPSSVFAQGGHAGADESLPYPSVHLNDYARTKALSEEMVLKANEGDFSTCSLRPHMVWGPGDTNILPRVIDKARLGKLKIVGDGENQVDVLYVENAARAHVMAMEELAPGSAVAGQAYFLGQGPVKLWQFVDDVLKLAGVTSPTSALTARSAYAVGWLLEKTWRFAGIKNPEPPMTRFIARNLSTDHWYAHAKAERDFGWTPRISIHEGLQRLFSGRDENRRLLGKRN